MAKAKIEEPVRRSIAEYEADRHYIVIGVDDHNMLMTQDEFDALDAERGHDFELSLQPASLDLCKTILLLTGWDDEGLDHYDDTPIYGLAYLHSKLDAVGDVTAELIDVEPDNGLFNDSVWRMSVPSAKASAEERAASDAAAQLCITLASRGVFKAA